MSPSDPWATAGDLHALASQVTGLEDFGPDDYSDGLAELIASLERDADLTPRGRKVMRAMLRGALAARLDEVAKEIAGLGRRGLAVPTGSVTRSP